VGYTRIETIGKGGFREWPGNTEPRSDRIASEEGREARLPGGQKTIFSIVIAVKTSNLA
jgi:hypothetical protein